jgi:DNA-binding transcriptional LysR family regulator
MSRIERTVANPATIDLNRIATWLRVVEAGSFTKAAQSLGVPKSSVSRAVTRLEQELGLDLLRRTTRKLSLTPEGERYLVSARQAVQLLHDAHAELMECDENPRGTVRFTAPLNTEGPLSAVLAPFFVAFGQRYPGIQVELIFTARRVDLLAEGIDIALRAGPLGDSSLIARKVSSGSLILVASPAYLTKHGTPTRLSDLAAHKLILFNGSEGGQRLTLSGPKGNESVVVRGWINVDEMSFQRPLAEAGGGIAMVPDIALDQSLATGRLVHVLPQYKRHGAAIHLVYPALRHVPRRVTLLREELYKALAEAFSDERCRPTGRTAARVRSVTHPKVTPSSTPTRAAPRRARAVKPARR